MNDQRTRATMEAEIREVHARRRGEHSYVLTDGSFVIEEAPEKRYALASLFKVPLLVSCLLRLPIDAATREQLANMIQRSDNEATDALLGRVGAGAVEEDCRERGVSVQVNAVAWQLSLASAAHLVALMALIHRGQSLPRPLCEVGLSLLGTITTSQRWGVAASIPPTSELYFKGGWMPDHDQSGRPTNRGWLVHQAGVLVSGNDALAFAFLNARQPTFSYGKETLRQFGAALAPWIF